MWKLEAVILINSNYSAVFLFILKFKKANFYLDKNYTWIHCDEFFTGYYNLDYTLANWQNLGAILRRADHVLKMK